MHLTPAGLSEDKTRLLLVSDTGEEYSLTIDSKLRAALRGEHARIGQLEIHMDSALRPRDIQARIRAGDTPEAVAQAAQTTVDRIMVYASPVLAERAHVASRAQRSSVRRKGDSVSSAARTLGDAVAATMRAMNIDPETVDWDAWRREDGQWTLTGEYSTPKRKGLAKFSFNMPGNFVVLDNDDARWLVGETVAKSGTARDDLKQARSRKLSAVQEQELPLDDEPALGDDAISLVNDEREAGAGADPEAPTEDLTEVAARVATAEEDPALAPTPEPFVGGDTGSQPERGPDIEPEVGSEETAADAESAPESGDTDVKAGGKPEPEPEPAPKPKPARRKGRASVPSWDEIMFGGSKQD